MGKRSRLAVVATMDFFFVTKAVPNPTTAMTPAQIIGPRVFA